MTIVDDIRVVGILFGLLAMSLLFRLVINSRRFHRVSPPAPWGWAGSGLLVLYVTLTEWEQIGKPLVWWRLPLGFVAVALVMVYYVKTTNYEREGNSVPQRMSPWDDVSK